MSNEVNVPKVSNDQSVTTNADSSIVDIKKILNKSSVPDVKIPCAPVEWNHTLGPDQIPLAPRKDKGAGLDC